MTQARRTFRSPQPRSRRLRLLGGLVLWVSTAYYAAVRQAGQSRGRAGTGLYPELAVLGLHDGQTVALAELVARQAALLPSFEHARGELKQRGLDLPLKGVHRIATRVGAQALTRRRRDLLAYRAGDVPAGADLAGKRVAVCIDAGKTRVRRVTRRQRGRGKHKTQRRRFRADWRDVKLLTIYEIDAHGAKVKGSRPWLDGTFAGPDEAMELLAFHLHRLGAARADLVVFLADGAPWIWERWPWVVQRVGLRWRQYVTVLDFWHAVHHVGLAVAALGLPGREQRRLYRKCRRRLQRGLAWEMIQELKQLGRERGVLGDMETALSYLERHEDACHLDYAAYRQRGLPIGSGAVESAIRRVINLRIKGPGLMWEKENAEGMVLLRAAVLSGRWEELMEQVWDSISRDRRLEAKWTSPDMRAELKAKIPIKPPVPQVQANQSPERIPA